MRSNAEKQTLAMPVAERRLGKRERNKLDKQQRIRDAARRLFEEKGYQETTVRDIADQAGIALGTVFLYASDKRDLLFLIVQDDLNDVTDRAFSKAQPTDAFVDQLIIAFDEFFRYFAKSPRVAQDMMREVVFYKKAGDMNQFHAGIARTENRIAQFVAQAQATGVITRNVAPDAIAKLIFSIYRMDIRNCFATLPPDIETGLNQLRGNLDILFNGLKSAEQDR
jgi:AcrR family transcriptional regulator